MANEDSQTSLLASTTLDAWGTTPSTWRRSSEIEFRVRRSGQPTRRLRLPGTRYTLGSGTGCSIRLEDASLRPLHAVLIRDDERILVHAYSVPFQINHRRTNEALLSVGDRLQLGAYEFELLKRAPDADTSSSQSLTLGMVHNDEPGVTQHNSDHHQQSRAFHEEAKQWRALKRDAQQRQTWCQTREQELQEQQDLLQKNLEALQAREANLQTQESAAAEVHEELQLHYQELLQHREELKQQQEELVTGREHLRLQQERLDGRDRLHRQQIDKLIGEQEQFKQVASQSRQKLADNDEQLHVSRQQAEAATFAVAKMREKFALLSEQLTQLTSHQSALKQLEAQRAIEHRQRTDELELVRDELELARDEALAERDYAVAQRDNVTIQRDEMSAQRDEMASQRDEITSQRDDIASQRDELAIERDELVAERGDIAIERDEIAACCHELELIQDQLRAEIEQLQSEIAQTRMQAETLDQDCRTAHHTIAGLENTIREQADRYEFDRQSWTAEVDTLRKNIDELSLELEHAQAQLTSLRDDNTQLSEQLTEATAERDQARAERETAIAQCLAAQEECNAAQRDCDTAKTDCESARRELETARADVKLARQERDKAAAHRDEILAQRDELNVHHDELAKQHDELSLEQTTWAEQRSQAERRYQDARTHLADAREKCELAVRARDAAEDARLAAEEKLAIATADLKAMQVERDEAIASQENLRRQRDDAIEDAKNTRELFDRSNRDHDDTLELIERLEQKTREAMGSFTLDSTPAEPGGPSRLSLLDQEVDTEAEHHAPFGGDLCLDAKNDQPMTLSTPAPSMVNETFDADEVWPTYSCPSDEPNTLRGMTVSSTSDEPIAAGDCQDRGPVAAIQQDSGDECTNGFVNIALPVIDCVCDDQNEQEHDQVTVSVPAAPVQAAPVPAPALSIATTTDHVKDVVNSEVDASSKNAAEDDSIEAYMNRLLDRVQGRITDTAALAAMDTTAVEAMDTAQDVTEQRDQEHVDTTPTAVVTESLDKSLLRNDSPAKNVPAAKKSKLNLAAAKTDDSPARSTNIRSQKSIGQTTRSQAMMKYAQMGASLLCGVAAVVLVNSPMLKIVAAGAALLVAAICAKEALAFKTEAMGARNSQRNSASNNITPSKAAA